jgi:hypothetical protein
MKNYITIAVLGICSFSLVACTKNQVTTTLGDVVDALAVAVDTTNPQDITYVTLVTACTDYAVTEIQSTDTPANIALKIASNCAGALSANNTGGKDVAALSGALKAFLASIAQLQSEIWFSDPKFVNAFTSGAYSRPLKRDLEKINKKLKKVHEKLGHIGMTK